MINLKPLVFNKLKEISILGNRVFFYYPSTFNSLPSISYYEITNQENSNADDDEYNSLIEIQVDVWGKTPEEISDIALQVDSKMKSIGFNRAFAQDVHDENLYHKTMRFSIIKEV